MIKLIRQFINSYKEDVARKAAEEVFSLIARQMALDAELQEIFSSYRFREIDSPRMTEVTQNLARLVVVSKKLYDINSELAAV